MKALIEAMLEEAPEGAIQAQVLVKGAMLPGALRRSPEYSGIYELLMITQQGSSMSSAKCYLHPDSIEALIIPQEASPIAQRKGSGIVIPGHQ